MFICENCLPADDVWSRLRFKSNMGISQGPCEFCDRVSLCVDAIRQGAHSSKSHGVGPSSTLTFTDAAGASCEISVGVGMTARPEKNNELEKAIKTLAKAKGVTAEEFKQSLVEKAGKIALDKEE